MDAGAATNRPHHSKNTASSKTHARRRQRNPWAGRFRCTRGRKRLGRGSIESNGTRAERGLVQSKSRHGSVFRSVDQSIDLNWFALLLGPASPSRLPSFTQTWPSCPGLRPPLLRAAFPLPLAAALRCCHRGAARRGAGFRPSGKPRGGLCSAAAVVHACVVGCESYLSERGRVHTVSQAPRQRLPHLEARDGVPVVEEPRHQLDRPLQARLVLPSTSALCPRLPPHDARCR